MALIVLSFLLGIFSMGFQLLGSRLLSPWFGSSIVVWAFLISTFLAAFSAGSLIGGWVAKLGAAKRLRVAGGIMVLTFLGFVFSAVFARALLGGIDAMGWPVALSLTVSCVFLFLPPVCGLATLTPLIVQGLHERGQGAGFASGLVYCVSTLGNIAGIMLAAFVLIPTVPVSVLLWIWAAGVAVCGLLLWLCFRDARPA